jgi:hypothetical protein
LKEQPGIEAVLRMIAIAAARLLIEQLDALLPGSFLQVVDPTHCFCFDCHV